ncbi:SDR family NAD(P)-dependent oxidoreductase [Rathayibacter soli]|uniref:SDR family NAD(P)-dependent oxidoreductase n=1 Tax=Rathayibacter soli TaxID=3144168 RepID=UPI0027E3C5B9|nr:SDR family NAD(P)-dependent oxidoreductase [Glaciibacter superstes]
MSIKIDLSGSVALVTGASGGIGKGIVQALHDAGATVIAADRDLSVLESTFAHMPERVESVAFDVTDEADVARGLESVASVGAPTIVVNGAGVAGRTGMPFTRLDQRDWSLPWQVNVVGTFLVSKAVSSAMIAAGGGAIVNIASVSGRTGFQTSPPYSASKAAVINITQVMARDLAVHNVRVNSICPGMVFTPFYAQQRSAVAENDPVAAAQTDEEFFAAKVVRSIPLGRGQTPQDVGNAVVFLASPLAGNITGQALNVDGGLVMS